MQSIDFINYYSTFFKLLHKTFYPLFYNLIYFNLSDLESYITAIICSYYCILSDLKTFESTLIPAAINTYKSIKYFMDKLKCSVSVYAEGLKDLKCAIKKIILHATIGSPQIKDLTAKLTVKYKINIADLQKSIKSCLCQINCHNFECSILESICEKTSNLKSDICCDINLLCCLNFYLRNFNMFDVNVWRLRKFILCSVPALERIKTCIGNILVDFNKDMEEKSKELKQIESELDKLEKCVQQKLDSLNKILTTEIKINGLSIKHEMTVECSPPKLDEDSQYKCFKSKLLGQNNHLNNIKSDMDGLKFGDSIGEIKRGASSITELLFKRYFRCSLESLSTRLINIHTSNNNMSTNNGSVAQINKFLMTIYSHFSIFECYFVISRLLECSKKIDQILQLVDSDHGCRCIFKLESSTINLLNLDNNYVHKIIEQMTKENRNQNNISQSLGLDKIRRLHNGDIKDNHHCLCMVTKYILYPQIINLVYLMSIDLDALSTISRKYDRYTHNTGFIQLSQFFILCVELLYKVSMYILLKYKYSWTVSGQKVEIKCFCMYSDDPYYPYLISIILFLSSLVENIWSIDNLSIVMGIERLSSLLSEYQSLHVYTNYYSPSSYKILRGLSGLTKGKLIEGTLSHSSVAVVGNNKQALVTSNVTLTSTLTESKENSEKTSTSVISTASLALVNESTKSGFMSLRTMILGTRFSKDKLTLIYNRFSRLCFNTEKCKKTTGLSNIKTTFISLSLKYLNELCKEETCNERCCLRNGSCQICPIAKIRINCLTISFKEMGLIIGNVSGDILLNYLMGSINITEDFITNLCVGFGEVYTIMLKNTQLTLPNYDIIKNPLNIVISRNWGYDTHYERYVTNSRNKPKDPSNYMTSYN